MAFAAAFGSTPADVLLLSFTRPELFLSGGGSSEGCERGEASKVAVRRVDAGGTLAGERARSTTATPETASVANTRTRIAILLFARLKSLMQSGR